MDAERRRIPSWLLVLVLDRLRVLILSTTASFTGSGSSSGTIDLADEESLDGSASLWLALEGSGVKMPVVPLDVGSVETARDLDSDIAGGVGSLGDGNGEGRCEQTGSEAEFAVVSAVSNSRTLFNALEVFVMSVGGRRPFSESRPPSLSLRTALSMVLGGGQIDAALKPWRGFEYRTGEPYSRSIRLSS